MFVRAIIGRPKFARRFPTHSHKKKNAFELQDEWEQELVDISNGRSSNSEDDTGGSTQCDDSMGSDNDATDNEISMQDNEHDIDDFLDNPSRTPIAGSD